MEDWIGKRVTVNVHSREEVRSKQSRISGEGEVLSDEENVSERLIVLGVEGFLAGVDPNGVIVLFDPRDVVGERGPVYRAELPPRYVFYPWQRISLIERVPDRVPEVPEVEDS